MSLSDAKFDTMVSSLQQFVTRNVLNDQVVALTTDQLLRLIDVTAVELKADNQAIIRLQEQLMLIGVCLVSLPTVHKDSSEGKPKKLYYIFRDTNSFLTQATFYSEDEFDEVLNSKQVTFADIQGLRRLNLPTAELAPIVCKSLGHSRLSTSKRGKCARCGEDIKPTDFTVLISTLKVGVLQGKFRPIDRLDWKDLIFVSDKYLDVICRSKKFDTIVDASNCYDLVGKPEDLPVGQDDEETKLALHGLVTDKKKKKRNP